MDQIIIPEYMEPIVVSYYQNNAKKLNNVVDKILLKLHFVDVDKNDFYSLANEIFMYTVRDYDKSQSFDGFLYSCLYKKFCTEMTSRKRDKRCTKVKVKEKNEKGEVIEKIVIIPDVSIYSPIGEDESSTIELLQIHVQSIGLFSRSCHFKFLPLFSLISIKTTLKHFYMNE